MLCIKVSRDCNEIISIRMVSSIEAKIILLLEANSLPPVIMLLSLKRKCILNATLLDYIFKEVGLRDKQTTEARTIRIVVRGIR